MAAKKPAPAKRTTKKPAAKTAAVVKRASASKPAKAVTKRPLSASKAKKTDKTAPKQAPKSLEGVTTALPPGLTGLEKAFVLEYSYDRNATRAYMRCRPAIGVESARRMGSALLSKLDVKQAIKASLEAQQTAIAINAADVVSHAWDVMTADPRELAETRVGCCRHCWGFEFRFQRTDAKLREDREAFELVKAMAPEKTQAKMGEFQMKGGGGYDKRLPANPDCPECAGEGEERIILKDSRKLSPQAAKLFAGAKISKSGRVEVTTLNKDAARTDLMRHFGLYNDKLALTMPMVIIKDLTGRKKLEPGK